MYILQFISAVKDKIGIQIREDCTIDIKSDDVSINGKYVALIDQLINN